MNHRFKSFAMDPFASFKNPLLHILSLSVSQMEGETDVMLCSFHSFVIMKESSWCFNCRKKSQLFCLRWSHSRNAKQRESLTISTTVFAVWAKWLWHIDSDWMHRQCPLPSSLAPPLGIWVPFFKLNWALLEAVCQIPSVPLRLFEYSTESSRWLIA